jgi:hypothetical protein
MNFISLSPHFPPNYYRFCISLRNKDVNVLGLGDAPYDSLNPNLRKSLTEYYHVDNLHHYDQLLRALGYFTHRYGKIDGIDSHNEYWLETEARLRADFNIDGLKPEALKQVTRKWEMKKVFRKAGIPVARGIKSATIDQSLQFAKEVGYPLVAKPDRGMGASHTFKIGDEVTLKNFLATKPEGDFIIEEFIHGNIVSFDGLADREGNILFYTAMQNEKGVMEVVHEDSHVYYYTLLNIPEDLIDAGTRTLKAFNVRGRFFHFEFFREHSTGRLVALEVNIRPPGGFSTDMFNFSADIDIYDEWAAMIANRPRHDTVTGKYHVCFVSRKAKNNYLLSHEVLLEKFKPVIVFHDRVEGALSNAMGDYCYLLRTNDLKVMFEVQQAIHQTV